MEIKINIPLTEKQISFLTREKYEFPAIYQSYNDQFWVTIYHERKRTEEHGILLELTDLGIVELCPRGIDDVFFILTPVGKLIFESIRKKVKKVEK